MKDHYEIIKHVNQNVFEFYINEENVTLDKFDNIIRRDTENHHFDYKELIHNMNINPRTGLYGNRIKM